MQAIANTGVQEGFSIIRTPDQRGSVEHLALFTRILQDKYQGLTLTSCSQVSYIIYDTVFRIQQKMKKQINKKIIYNFRPVNSGLCVLSVGL